MNVAICLQLVFGIGKQVDVAEGDEAEDKGVDCFLRFIQGDAHVAGYLRYGVFRYQLGKAGFQFFSIGLRVEQQPGEHAYITPGLFPEMKGSHTEEGIEVKAGVVGNFIDDAGYGADAVVADGEGFTNRRFSAKIFFGKGPGDDQRIGPRQGGMRISIEEGEGKDLKEVGVDKGQLLLFELFDTVLCENAAQPLQPGIGLYFGVSRFHPGTYRDVNRGIRGQAIADDAQVDPVDIFCFRRVLVVAGFVVYIGRNKQAAGKTDGQTKDVDEGKNLVFP